MSEVILPLPPSLNQMYRVSPQGKLYKTEECKAWQEEAAWIIKSKKFEPLLGKVLVWIYMGIQKRRDIDSVIKITLDALQDSGLIKNDSQIYKLVIDKIVSLKEKPYLSVMVERL